MPPKCAAIRCGRHCVDDDGHQFCFVCGWGCSRTHFTAHLLACDGTAEGRRPQPWDAVVDRRVGGLIAPDEEHARDELNQAVGYHMARRGGLLGGGGVAAAGGGAPVAVVAGLREGVAASFLPQLTLQQSHV